MGRRATAHIRSNIVAYLALFVALGGTSYAVSGAVLDDRSVEGRKLAPNTLGGAEIDEARLGTVRRSLLATRGARTALTAYRALRAERAIDSNLLGGLGAPAYLRDFQLDSGAASYVPGLPATALLDSGSLGLLVQTDGDGDGNAEVRVSNTGPVPVHVAFDSEPTAATLAPGASLQHGPRTDGGGLASRVLTFVAAPAGARVRTFVTTCAFHADGIVACSWARPAS